MAVEERLNSLAEQLRRYSFRFRHEADLQEGIERILEEAVELAFGPAIVEREVRIDGRSRVDFHVVTVEWDRIGIEVKVGGSPSALRRQLWRYADSGKLEALLLVCGRRRLLAGIDDRDSIRGIPFAIVETWEAGLR